MIAQKWNSQEHIINNTVLFFTKENSPIPSYK
jgi:hypothetical protein